MNELDSIGVVIWLIILLAIIGGSIALILAINGYWS